MVIDLIIRDPDRCVLVWLRTNEPAKGKWFVPGGVVIKYERLADAFARIVKAEIGLQALIGDAKFIGSMSTCTTLTYSERRRSARTTSCWRTMTPAELISSPDVH